MRTWITVGLLALICHHLKCQELSLLEAASEFQQEQQYGKVIRLITKTVSPDSVASMSGSERGELFVILGEAFLEKNQQDPADSILHLALEEKLPSNLKNRAFLG